MDSFNKYVLSACYLLTTVLGTADTTKNKKQTMTALCATLRP